MLRLFILLLCLVLTLPTIAQAPASKTVADRAQKSVSSHKISVEDPWDELPQNTPCASQAKSSMELAAAFHQGRFPLPSQISGTWVEIGSISSLPANKYRYLNCSGEGFRNGKLVSVLIVKGDRVEMYFNDGSQSGELSPDHRGSVEFSRDFYADGAKQTYRCRLTKRGTLACLFDPRVGAEFKKMKVDKSQLVEASSWN